MMERTGAAELVSWCNTVLPHTALKTLVLSYTLVLSFLFKLENVHSYTNLISMCFTTLKSQKTGILVILLVELNLSG